LEEIFQIAKQEDKGIGFLKTRDQDQYRVQYLLIKIPKKKNERTQSMPTVMNFKRSISRYMMVTFQTRIKKRTPRELRHQKSSILYVKNIRAKRQ
jgi:hypothetical protein